MNEQDAKNADLSALRIDRGTKKAIPGRRKRWLYVLWLAVPVVLYFGYRTALHEVAPTVKVQTAAAQVLAGSEASADLVATGYVVAQVKAAVSSKATGRLRVLNVEEGDKAQAGEVLAELESDDIRAELDLARANLKRARADSVEAFLAYRRQEKLVQTGHSTQELLDVATAAHARANAEVEAMAANLKAVEVALESTVIRAPFAGTVLTKHADVGEMVAPLASATSSRGAVVTMADMTSLEVEADVSESNINKVKINGPCEIVLDAYPNYIYRGHVKKIVPTADRARATVMTKVAFDTIDDRVLPEMSARVNFLPSGEASPAVRQNPVIVVPKSAITTRDGQKIVFAVTDGIAKQIPVETGREFGKTTEILAGLRAGEVVILSPAGALKSGDKVE